MKQIAAFAALFVFLQVRVSLPTQTPAEQVRAFGEPLAVLDAEKAWLGAGAFWPLVRDVDAITRRYAIRAIGRLEDPANVPALLALGQQPRGPAAEAADAIVQSLYNFDPSRNPKLIDDVAKWFVSIGFANRAGAPPPTPLPMGRIAYNTDEQFHAAERKLLEILERFGNEHEAAPLYADSASSMESLFRLNRKLGPPDDATIERLRRMVGGRWNNDTPLVRSLAMRALLARGAAGPILRTALDADVEELQRLAAPLLASTSIEFDDEQRVATIQSLLARPSAGVRLEALRVFTAVATKARGCQPIVDMMADPDSHVALAAIDALGDVCKADEEITRRLEGEVRVPPAVGPWHRAMHLFVTLARRDPSRVALLMGAVTGHPVFWVRMYAVSAVVAARDLDRLEQLALDADDNVREAALEPLLVLKHEQMDSALIGDLGRNDVQLLRTAAMLAKKAPPADDLRPALVGAVMRLTALGKETSRDARLALLEALEVHARAQDVQTLKPLLKDVDPLVAGQAAKLLSKLDNSEVKADPTPIRRASPQSFTDVANQCVSVALSSGKSFVMRMDPQGAPIAADRFLRMALVDHYYDGLSFHRVVPGFVIQGGSPGSNEYSGGKEFLRDEIALPNQAGSVGLSIRGRNTGDAQFYINLVDNRRLDGGYTIFAHVVQGMEVVQAIEEGDVMKITSQTCSR